MKQITLTQGKVALVDDEDYDYLSQWKWQALKQRNNWYAVRNEYISADKYKMIRMHRVIMKITDPKVLIDHRDTYSLNNMKSNLRVCSNAENCRNSHSRKNTSSSYLGVSKSSVKHRNKITYNNYWMSQIQHNKKHIFLGRFPFTPEGEILAAKTYDVSALEYHGEFANLNFK